MVRMLKMMMITPTDIINAFTGNFFAITAAMGAAITPPMRS